MPASERASLPLQIQPLIEQRFKGRGSFRVYCLGVPPEGSASFPESAKGNGYGREVRLNGITYQAFVSGQWQNQTSLSDASIDGIILNDAIALVDAHARPAARHSTPDPRPSSDRLYLPTRTGPNTLLYIIAQFSDESSDPIDDATALSQMAVVSTFWLNNSAGTVSLRGLVNSTQVMDIVHITLPQPKSYGPTYNNDFGQLLDDARSAAAAQGFYYTNYNLDLVVTSNQGFSYGGRAYIGDQGCHLVKGNTSLRTAGHELGHNLGLNHANYWRTDSNQPFGRDSNPGGYVTDTSNSEWVEYGHYFSVMSGQTSSEMDDPAKPYYAPTEKAVLGWLSGDSVRYVSASSSTNRLFRHDSRFTTGNPRGIRIDVPATDYTGLGRHYWLGYRYAPWSAAQTWLRNGVQVDVAANDYGFDGTTLLDMTPYSNDASVPFFDPNNKPSGWWAIDNSDKLDGALLVGRTYNDNAAGIHITPISIGSNGTNEEFIDVVINLGRFPNNRPPVITSFSVSTNHAAINQLISFSAVASDPDGDALAWSWDFDDSQNLTTSALNSPTTSKRWPNPGQYRVTATVSDMKGGVATRSQIVTVDVPANTGEIWGRVVWGGLPVFGARVWAVVDTNVYPAWTASDGSYVIANLPSTNSYTLQCRGEGLTFSPQFVSPISLLAGNAYGKDFYANEPLLWGGLPGFTISGQITYAGAAVAGAVVRAGGFTTATDWLGNYQITNLPSGAYMTIPSKDNWTFVPTSRMVILSSTHSTGNDFSRLAPYTISGRIDGLPSTTNDPVPQVYLSNGAVVDAALAGSAPNTYWSYTLTNVPAGRFGVMPVSWGNSFSPVSFTNPLLVTGNLTSINFSSTVAQVAGSIVGRITEHGLPVEGLLVQAADGVSATAFSTTDSDGFYSIDNLALDQYTVTPISSIYSFAPASLPDVYAGTSDNDFAATGTNAPPAILSVTADPEVVPNAGSNATLSTAANGSDPLIYSWAALTGSAPVAFSTNDSSSASSTIVSFQAPGNYSFMLRVIDSHGFSAISNVSLSVTPLPAMMAVSPYQVQIPKGSAVTFRADAWDELGGSITLTPSWSASGGGSIDTSGLYSATIPGPYQVSAVAGTLSSSAFVSVLSTSQVPVMVITSLSNGSFLLRFDGLPDVAYRIEYTETLNQPMWQTLTAGAANQFGIFQFIETPPAGTPRRYYRAVYP